MDKILSQQTLKQHGIRFMILENILLALGLNLL